jgi:hypothetical protein
MVIDKCLIEDGMLVIAGIMRERTAVYIIRNKTSWIELERNQHGER